MKMIKKLLSAVTAVVVLSSVTLSAAAAAADSAEGGAGKAAPAGFMEYLGIISGKTDVLYTQTVKRGDFAEYLAKLLKYTAAGDTDGRYFTDVTDYDYAEAAINYLTDADIISVPDDRKFRPAEDITTDEAVKMVVCALGYRPMAEAHGGFPSGYNRAARQYSLLKNVGGERFTLNDAAQLLFNALITPLYSVASVSGSEGEYTYEYKVMPENTLLHSLYSMGCIQNVLTGADGIDVWSEKQSDDKSVVIGGEIYKTESAADFTEYLGMDVFGIYGCETAELVYVFPSSYGRSRIVAISAENYISFGGDEIRYVENSGGRGEKTVTADIKDAVLLYNGAVPKRNTQEIMNNLIDGEIRLMDFDGDGRYNAVTVDNYESFVMKYYDGASSTIFAKNSSDYIDLDSYEYVTLKDESGKAIDAADIPADSVLNIMATHDGERIKITVMGKSIEGQVEEINSSDGIYGGTEVKIDGKAYRISRQYKGALENAVGVGSSIIAYINMFDRLIAAEAFNPDGYNTAYMMNAVIDSASFDKTLKLYMYKSDGKIDTKSCAARITVDGIEYKSSSAAAAAFPQCVVSSDTVTITPQIIKYRENTDGFITEIDTYNQGSESAESSLARTVGQESEVMKFNARIGKKEVLSANTKVYHVPQDSNVMSATEKDFKILGTNSINSRYSFKLECYRLRGGNEYADIVVYRRSFDDTRENDWWNSSVFLVKENYEMSDADSEGLRRITGLINGGEGYIDVYESELADTVKISPKDIKEGDLIRYRTNFNGRVHDIELLYDPSGYDFSNWKNYNEAVSLFDPTYDQYFQLSFGYVSESSVHNVGWGYKTGAQTDELVDLSSVPCMFFDRNEREGKRVYIEKSASVRDYKAFGDECDRIIVHLKNGNPAAAVIYR